MNDSDKKESGRDRVAAMGKPTQRETHTDRQGKAE